MSNEKRRDGSLRLPEFLRVSVEKGIIDERTAYRLELHRRTRDAGNAGIQSAFLNDPPDPDLTFDTYLVCKGNSFAVELARTIAAQPHSRLPYNPLYLYGDIGLGKTHLLSAIANEAHESQALLVNTADLEAELQRAQRLKLRAELRQWLISVDILLIDDIQLCEGREDLQRDIFSIVSYMTKAHRLVVISSDVPPTRLAGVESRLLSRLEGGVIVSLQMGDKTERRNLVEHFLDKRPMSHEVIDYVAGNVTDNVRRLKAVVTQLLTLHETLDEPLTVDLVRSLVPEPKPATSHTLPAGKNVVPAEIERKPARKTASRADRFKEMLAGAESEAEQALALQIALGERIRELRNTSGGQESIRQLENALSLLRDGKLEEAIRCIST
ncbi:MAG: DnaA/Hda family protein [Pseudomonadota bacterium]